MPSGSKKTQPHKKSGSQKPPVSQPSRAPTPESPAESSKSAAERPVERSDFDWSEVSPPENPPATPKLAARRAPPAAKPAPKPPSPPVIAGPSTPRPPQASADPEPIPATPAERVNQHIKGIVWTTRMPTLEEGKGKTKDQDPPPSHVVLPYPEELDDQIRGFAALAILMNEGRQVIQKLCEQKPDLNPFGDKDELAYKIQELRDELQERERTHIKRRYGLDEYKKRYQEMDHEIRSIDRAPSVAFARLQAFFGTQKSIQRFFDNSLSYADELIFEMYGWPRASKTSPFSIPRPKMEYSPDDLDTTLSPVRRWSRLNLEPQIRQIFCLPALPAEYVLELWQELKFQRYQEFCDTRRAVRCCLKRLQDRHGPQFKQVPGLEKHIQELQEDIMDISTMVHRIDGLSPDLDKSQDSRGDIVPLGHTREYHKTFRFKVSDDLDMLRQVLPDFIQYAKKVLRIERDMVFNSDAGVKEQELIVKIAAKWQPTTQEGSHTSQEYLLSSPDPADAGIWEDFDTWSLYSRD